MISMVHKILPLRYASVRMTFEAFLAFLCASVVNKFLTSASGPGCVKSRKNLGRW